MTIRKLAEPDLNRPSPCQHPEHKPPSMLVLEPGAYEHECPGCHAKQIIIKQDMRW